MTLLDRARMQSPEGDWTTYWVKQSGAKSTEAYIPTIASNTSTLGELLYILRPLVYGENPVFGKQC